MVAVRIGVHASGVAQSLAGIGTLADPGIADLFSRETGLSISQKILKFDGRPFTAQEIINNVKESL